MAAISSARLPGKHICLPLAAAASAYCK